MELVSERELVKLLAEFQNTNLADKAGKDDYAFLQETIFPTLLPALVHLSEHLEAQGVVPPPAGYKIEARGAEQASAGSSQKVNPQRWLAEHLVRHHPAGQVFKHDSAYAEHLNKIAKGRKEQRVERERLVIEQQRTVSPAAGGALSTGAGAAFSLFTRASMAAQSALGGRKAMCCTAEISISTRVFRGKN